MGIQTCSRFGRGGRRGAQEMQFPDFEAHLIRSPLGGRPSCWGEGRDSHLTSKIVRAGVASCISGFVDSVPFLVRVGFFVANEPAWSDSRCNNFPNGPLGFAAGSNPESRKTDSIERSRERESSKREESLFILTLRSEWNEFHGTFGIKGPLYLPFAKRVNNSMGKENL